MILLGLLALALIGGLEWSNGTITPWDRWFYPALWLLIGSAYPLLDRHPQRAYLLITVALSTYLVVAELLALFVPQPGTTIAPVLTATLWMPLAYTVAFIFLPMRTAVLASAVTFTATFLPLAAGLVLGRLQHWGPELPGPAVNMALAHAVYIAAQSSFANLHLRYLRSRERVRVVEELARTDMLTGLANRRELARELDAQIALARRTHQALSVMMLDVDHFKQINDLHGHAVGDSTLVQLGTLLSSRLRGSDRFGRWGGEEFLVVAPGVHLAGALEAAERLRVATMAAPLGALPQRLTVSAGVAELGDQEDAAGLLKRADEALYRAKQRGRNRVEG